MDHGSFRSGFVNAIAEEANASDHLVGAAGEHPQHPARIGIIERLFQDMFVDHDDGVGAEDQNVR